VISVVIPSRNRPESLARCLQAIAGLEYPKDRFEVIVVDDGSEPSLDHVVSAFTDRLDIVSLKQAHAGPAAARNAGAARASGSSFVFLDDDCVPANDWLRALEARIAAARTHAIGGRALNGLRENLYSSASQLLVDYLYEYYNTRLPRPSFFASNNVAFPREGFHEIGGFDVRFTTAGGEDRDLCERWLQNGAQMTYAPEVIVYHEHPLTLTAFWRQHFRYGRTAFCFHQARAQRRNGRVALEPLPFYLDLLRYPFSKARGRHALLLAMSFVLSQVANAAGFLWERCLGGLRPPVDPRIRTRMHGDNEGVR
jgi:GT2 family glycosyltransferase